ESFMVNCAWAAPAKASAATQAIVFMSGPQEKPDAGKRDLGNEGDQHQRGEVDEDERDDATVDDVELEPERRLRDEDVDAAGRVEETNRQNDGHDDAEVHGVDADRLDQRHE